jgi:hypothetical protein
MALEARMEAPMMISPETGERLGDLSFPGGRQEV